MKRQSVAGRRFRRPLCWQAYSVWCHLSARGEAPLLQTEPARYQWKQVPLPEVEPIREPTLVFGGIRYQQWNPACNWHGWMPRPWSGILAQHRHLDLRRYRHGQWRIGTKRQAWYREAPLSPWLPPARAQVPYHLPGDTGTTFGGMQRSRNRTRLTFQRPGIARAGSGIRESDTGTGRTGGGRVECADGNGLESAGDIIAPGNGRTAPPPGKASNGSACCGTDPGAEHGTVHANGKQGTDHGRGAGIGAANEAATWGVCSGGNIHLTNRANDSTSGTGIYCGGARYPTQAPTGKAISQGLDVTGSPPCTAGR